MTKVSLANWLAGFALALALTAFSFLLMWDGYYSSGRSLIGVNGAWVVWLLLVPVTLSAMAFVLSFRRTRSAKAWMWTLTFVLLGFSWTTGATIGGYFLPCALVLLAGTALHSISRPRDQSAPTL